MASAFKAGALFAAFGTAFLVADVPGKDLSSSLSRLSNTSSLGLAFKLASLLFFFVAIRHGLTREDLRMSTGVEPHAPVSLIHVEVGRYPRFRLREQLPLLPGSFGTGDTFDWGLKAFGRPPQLSLVLCWFRL